MSVPRIKALTKRIRHRIGSSEEAARRAGLKNKGAWSLYESEDYPGTTLPIHRFLIVANSSERAELIDMLMAEDDEVPECLTTEVSETTEAAADLQREAREAQARGPLSPLAKQRLRQGALRVKEEADDVLQIVGRAG